MKGPRGVVVKCQPTKRLPDCTCIKKKTKRLPDCTYIEKKKNDVRTFRKPANRPLVVIATMAQRATLAVERTIDHARGVHQHEGGRGRLGTYLQSHVVYEGWPEVPQAIEAHVRIPYECWAVLVHVRVTRGDNGETVKSKSLDPQVKAQKKKSYMR